MIFVIHTSTTSLPTPTGKPAFNSLQCMLSENKPKNTLQVIRPRKWLYRELFTAFFQHWVNLISLLKSPFFGLLKRSNTCLICAGGPLGDLYATAIHSSANRDFLYMESGSISGPCINLAQFLRKFLEGVEGQHGQVFCSSNPSFLLSTNFCGICCKPIPQNQRNKF